MSARAAVMVVPEKPNEPRPSAMHVRSRRVIGNGRVRLELTVPCSERGIDVPIEVCGHCDRCGGLSGDPTTQGVEIACQRPSEPVCDGEAAPRRRSAATTPVSAIMSTDVVCLERDLAVATLGPVMLSLDVSGAAVVDAGGRAIGVLSQSDVLRWLYAAQGEPDRVLDLKVEALMTTPVLCLAESDSIAKAAALMAFESIHRIAVVGSDGKLTGMLSPLDVMRWMAQENGYIVRPFGATPRTR